MLDNPNIVTFDRYSASFAGELAVEPEVNLYVAKYVSVVTDKDFYKKSRFTKEQAVEALRNLEGEEKELFVLSFKKGVLEAALLEAGGTPQEIAEIDKCRKEGENLFREKINEMVQNVMQADRTVLEEYGVPDEIIDRFETLRTQLTDVKKSYISQNAKEISALFRDMAMRSNNPTKFWTEYVSGAKPGDDGKKSGDEEENSFLKKIGRQEPAIDIEAMRKRSRNDDGDAIRDSIRSRSQKDDSILKRSVMREKDRDAAAVRPGKS
jgi:hypothetical protein